MLKREKLLVAMLALMSLIPAVGHRQLLSQDPDPNSPPPWAIEFPGDGDQVLGPPSFLGTGPADSIGVLYVFEQNNYQAGGVYASELTLKRQSYINTEGFSIWNCDPYGWCGLWFACVVPSESGQGTDEPPFLPDPMGPEEDVNNICESLGGDGASYEIIEEMPTL